MCGVIGLIYERHRADLGRIAATLLETLEYRGYDSTGAAIQGEGEDVCLLKGVGAPSQMVHELGIVDQAGSILAGQVRWATFGAVNETNSQPHVVRCKSYLYGAHNGNVTNCDDLQSWLRSEGHAVLSDNDGEMVVHTVEHFFALELAKAPDCDRRVAMRSAIVMASVRLEGSFAAVIVDPVTRTLWAIKKGSSLYFGQGEDEIGGAFRIASSDLSSVLQLTRVVTPLKEGEFVEFTPGAHTLYSIRDGAPIERGPVRSRLRAKDTALLPQFATFMEQEIAAQEQACRDVVTLFCGGTEASKVLSPYIAGQPTDERTVVRNALDELRDEYADDVIAGRFAALCDRPEVHALVESIPEDVRRRGTDKSREQLADRLVSSEAGFFADLLSMCRGPSDVMVVRLLDVMLESDEVTELADAVARFTALCLDSVERGGRIYMVCCGSSYHAAKAASLFFNEVARTEVTPVLPGEFRGQHARSLGDGDLFIAISQSGETKDLIDVMNSVIATGKDIGRIAVVNNINSTLAQEKSDLVIPLRCGPETAVPATKSFMNQMAVLYCLALRLAQRRDDASGPELAERLDKLPRLPDLIRETFEQTAAEVDMAAQQLFLAPSIHILATRINAVAKEGALKIREVVLNHTEGFEGSEFKHGPNTILGFNTLWGPAQVDALLKKVGETLEVLLTRAAQAGLPAESMGRLSQAVTDRVFSATSPSLALTSEERTLLDATVDHEALVASLYADYPLIYVTGPDERDVQLTISALNTHKIRGSSTVVIAQESSALRQAATKAPADNASYRSVYITLPRTNDTLMTMFSATVVLQRLALAMSTLKMQHLDRLGIKDHGVHPDVPKNVSKSITVD